MQKLKKYCNTFSQAIILLQYHLHGLAASCTHLHLQTYEKMQFREVVWSGFLKVAKDYKWRLSTQRTLTHFFLKVS